MHHTVSGLALAPVAVKFIVHNDTPMFLESVRLSFEVAVSLMVNVCALDVYSKRIYHCIFFNKIIWKLVLLILLFNKIF